MKWNIEAKRRWSWMQPTYTRKKNTYPIEGNMEEMEQERKQNFKSITFKYNFCVFRNFYNIIFLLCVMVLYLLCCELCIYRKLINGWQLVHYPFRSILLMPRFSSFSNNYCLPHSWIMHSDDRIMCIYILHIHSHFFTIIVIRPW